MFPPGEYGVSQSMGAYARSSPATPRRIEALAYIIERIQRSGTSPSYGEIGRALRPEVDKSRARQLVNQLVALGVIERPPASRRGIRIRETTGYGVEFGRDDYVAMAAQLATIAGSFIMSINDTPFVREAFAAFDIQEVETTWTIGTVATGAGAKVTELIIRNKAA